MGNAQEVQFNDSDVKEDIARRIAYWRVQAELSQAELSRRIEKNSGEVSKWESGEVTPNITSIHRIAVVCGVSMAMFLTAQLPTQE